MLNEFAWKLHTIQFGLNEIKEIILGISHFNCCIVEMLIEILFFTPKPNFMLDKEFCELVEMNVELSIHALYIVREMIQIFYRGNIKNSG